MVEDVWWGDGEGEGSLGVMPLHAWFRMLFEESLCGREYGYSGDGAWVKEPLDILDVEYFSGACNHLSASLLIALFTMLLDFILSQPCGTRFGDGMDSHTTYV